MTRSTFRRAGALFAAVALAFSTGAAEAGDNRSQSSFGTAFFSAAPPCPVKQFPTFESVAPVPAIIDPFQEDLIPVFCTIQVTKEGKGVKKAKGSFTSRLMVIDNETGFGDSFEINSGKFKTNSSGVAQIDFDLPAELFADGFESGDVSAWSYTRTDFSNKKKADNGSISCATGGSEPRGPSGQ